MSMMWKRLYPAFHLKKLADLSPEFLQERGLKGVMLDLDNTPGGMGRGYGHSGDRGLGSGDEKRRLKTVHHLQCFGRPGKELSGRSWAFLG